MKSRKNNESENIYLNINDLELEPLQKENVMNNNKKIMHTMKKEKIIVNERNYIWSSTKQMMGGKHITQSLFGCKIRGFSYIDLILNL